MREKTRQRERRLFSREFKLMVVRRLEEAGNVSALADELGVRRVFRGQKERPRR